jgi:stage V sporulation protein SpoVS
MTPPVTHRVRLHFKVLKLLPGEPKPKMTPQAMKDCMAKVYAPHGIDVVVAPAVEELDLEVLTDLTVGGCALGNTTTEQKQLFGNRKDVPDDEICVYFVASTHLSWAGCASRADADPNRFPNGRPAAVVTRDATAWTLGHECGHVLGLSHVDSVEPITRLMVRETAKITANPAALAATEADKIKQSPFTKPVPPGASAPPPAAPAPAPPAAPVSPDADAADAIPKLDKADGLADAIEIELDKDDGIDYEGLARKLGPSGVDALGDVVRESRPRIAAGAVDLAGMIERGGGLSVVAQGAARDDRVVRVAAAAIASRLPEESATRLVMRLLADDDVGVRGHAVRSAVRIGTDSLRERVGEIAAHDESRAIQELAADLLDPQGESAS